MESSMVPKKGIPRLDALPEELLSNISVRLDADDISSLRLTCKSLEVKSFHEFAKEYFTEKGFMLTTESLKVLVGIASNERLRSRLKVIYLLVGYIPPRAINEHICGLQPTTRQREAYLTYAADQKNLKDTHEDFRKIAGAFAALPKLAKLALCDAPGSIPADVDIPGYRRFVRRTTSNPVFATPKASPRDAEYPNFLYHAWQTLLAAIAGSGISTLTDLSTLLSPRNGLPTSGLIFPKDERERSRKALSTLKSLSLDLRSVYVKSENGEPDAKASGARMRKFASVLPAINELHLVCDGASSSGSLCTSFVSGLDTTNLTSLNFNTLCINARKLSTIISACSLLKVFRIVMVDLKHGSWVSVLKSLQKMPKLEHLDLMFLREGYYKAFFLTQKEPIDDAEDIAAADLFNIFGGPQTQTPGGGDGSQDEEQEDDELPDLENGQPIAAANTHGPATASAADVMDDETVTDVGPGCGGQEVDEDREDDSQHREELPSDEDEEFKAPGMEDLAERGYYICVKGADKVAKWLPIFIEQYNLGEEGHSVDGLPGFMLGPPIPLPPPSVGQGPNAGQGAGPNGGLGAQLLNSLMTLTGGIPPMPMPVGNGQGAGGQAGAAQGANGQGQAAQGAQGPTQGAAANQFGFLTPTYPAGSNPPPLPGPPPPPYQDHGHVAAPSTSTTTTSTSSASPNTATGNSNVAHSSAQSTTAVHDSAAPDSGTSVSAQGAAAGPGGPAFPDTWMLEDEEALYSDSDEVD